MAVFALAAVALAVTGCSGKAAGDQATGGSTPPPPSTKAAAPKEAGVIAAAMRAKIPQVTAIKIWTAADDPNQLLGRPGQYASSATLLDKRTGAAAAEGADSGATVEVFTTEEDAAQRAHYIDVMLDGQTMLGTEYHTQVGTVLLRVTGKLTPAVNALYAAAFRTAADA